MRKTKRKGLFKYGLLLSVLMVFTSLLTPRPAAAAEVGNEFAIYSEDDQGLKFYVRDDKPKVGASYDGRVVTAIYTEFDNLASGTKPPWNDGVGTDDCNTVVTNVEFVDEMKPESLYAWFMGFKNLKDVDMSKLDTSECETFYDMFSGCSVIKYLDVSHFNTSSCENFNSMFNHCYELEYVDVSEWDTSQSTTFAYMFRDCYALKYVDVSNWNVSKSQLFARMFSSCNSLTELDLSGWKTGTNVSTYDGMFINCKNLRELDLRGFKTKTDGTTTMGGIFQDCDSLKKVVLNSGITFKAGVTASSNGDYDETDFIKSSTIFPKSPAGSWYWGKSKAVAFANDTIPSPTNSTFLRSPYKIYYVAYSQGSDSNNGTSLSTPVQTLKKAYELIAAAKCDAIIYITEQYHIYENIELTEHYYKGSVYAPSGIDVGKYSVEIRRHPKKKDGTENVENMFLIPSGYTLNISDIVINGGMRAMTQDHHSTRLAGEITSAVNAAGNIVVNTGGTLIAGDGLIVKNSGTQVMKYIDPGTGVTTPTSGGAIYNYGTATINGGLYIDNCDCTGGAFYNGGTMTIRGGVVVRNEGINDAGGIYNTSKLYIDGGVIARNFATQNYNADTTTGGGIYNATTTSDQITMRSGMISANTSQAGAGIFNDGAGILKFYGDNDSTNGTYTGIISGNIATSQGGGVFNEGSLTLSTVNVRGNHAINGGGVYNASTGTASIGATGAKVNHNRATNYGAGIYNNGVMKLTGIVRGNILTASKDVCIGGGVFTKGSEEVTIQGGHIRFNEARNTGSYKGYGAGVGVAGTNVTITASSILYNKADYNGGGIYVNSAGALTLNGSAIYINSNKAANGGGLFNNGTTTITQVGGFNNNEATSCGGGIYAKGTMSIANTRLSKNKAVNGGGIYENGSTSTTLSGVTIENNTASDSAGGLYAGPAVTYPGTVSITKNTANNGGGVMMTDGTLTSNVTISNNTAHSGAGLFVNGTSAVINGATISDNAATGAGGGINNAGTLEMKSGTVTKNTAYGGGGINNESGATFNLTGGTISNNVSLDASNGGGGRNLGTMTATGGAISGNTADSGGAIFNNGTLRVSAGVAIQNNKAVKGSGDGATGRGGAIFVGPQSQSTIIDGGTISGNTATDAGDGIGVNGPITMKGAALINAADEVYLYKDRYITVSTALTASGKVATIVPNSYENGRRVAVSTYGSKLGSNIYSKFTLQAKDSFALRPGDYLDNDFATSHSLTDADVIISSPLTVTYSGNSTGTVSNLPSAQSPYWCETMTISSNTPTQTGYTFQKWNTYANGSGASYNKGASAAFEKNTTLYAQWAANSYTVTLSKGTGISSVTGAGAYSYGASVTAKATVSTGYTFKNWTDVNGNIKSTSANYTFAMPASNVEFTANATENTYTIQFDGNGATSGTMSSLTGIKYTASTTLTANDFKKTGYTFIVWNTKADGSGTSYANGATVSKLTGTNNGTVTLYAQWTPNKYKVTLNNQGADSAGTTAYWYEYNTTRTVNGVTAYYYSDANCTTPLQNGYVINIPQKANHTFKGYYTGTNGSGTQYVNASGTCVNNLYKAVANDITLYAYWTQNEAAKTITFNANGGSGSMSSITNIYQATTTTLTANAFTRSGYRFIGWNTKADGSGTGYADKATISGLTQSITLYAQWASGNHAYVNGVSGSDSNNGATADTAYLTVGKAYETLKANGGTIYIVRPQTFTSNVTLGSTKFSDGSRNITVAEGKVVIKRYSKPSATVAGFTTSSNTDSVLVVADGYNLTLDNAEIDGHRYTRTGGHTEENAPGVNATAAMIRAAGANSTLTIKNSTIINGTNVNTTDDFTKEQGAAVRAYNAVIENSTFYGHSSSAGGTINIIKNLTLTGGSIYDNTTTDTGSAIYMLGTKATGLTGMKATISNVNIYNNTGTSSTSGKSSTLFCGNGVTTSLTNVNFYNNSSNIHAGVILNHGALTMTGGTIHDNTSRGSGAAIYLSSTITNPTATIDGVVIYNNVSNLSGQAAGAIRIEAGSQMTIKNTTIRNNSANGPAGAIYNQGTMTITDSDIYSNEAQNGDGGAIKNEGTLTITGTEIYSNSASGNGGGIKVESGSKLVMSSGSIQGNTAALGSGIYHNGGTVELSGSALIDSDNDVYLVNGAYITVTGALSNSKVATITPNSYSAGRKVAQASYSGANATAILSKFALTPSGSYTLRASDKLNDSVYSSDNDVIISAPYTITYNKNLSDNVSGLPNPTTVYWNEDYAVSSAPTHSNGGYTFNSWNTAANGSGTKYTVGETRRTTSNVTLYAQWAANSYSLAIDPNGGYRASDGSTSVITVTKQYGASENISLRKRTGYTLTGYIMKNTATGSTASADLGGATFTFDSAAGTGVFTQGSVGITLVAQWQINSYAVTLSKGTGIDAVSGAATYQYNTSVTVQATPSLGYTFKNWTDTSGNVKSTNTSYTFNMPASNVALTANATENTYTIAFNANGGSNSMGSITGIKYTASQSLTANAFTRTGYTFNGWNTKADGSGTSYADKASVSKLTATNGATVTLYAQWKANTGTIHYNDGSNLFNGVVDVGVTAGSKMTYTVTDGVFEVTAGNASDGYGYTYLHADLVAGETYTFSAETDGTWTAQTEAFLMKDKSTAESYYHMSSRTKTFTPTVSGTYWLRLDVNTANDTRHFSNIRIVKGSTASGITGYTPAQEYTYGTPTIIKENKFTRKGYAFTGWNTKADGSGASYQPGASVSNLATSGDVTLYAQWAPIYKVTLDNLGADQSGTTAYWYIFNTKKVINGTTVYYYADEDCMTPLVDGCMIDMPIKSGYGFRGYFTETSGNGIKYVDADGKCSNNLYETVASDSTLYAYWEAGIHKVTFNPNGGTLKNPGGNLNNGSNTDSISVTYGKSNYYAMPGDIPTRTGYNFTGWYTAPSDGTQVYNAAGYAIQGTGYWNTSNQWVHEGDITVYAHWEFAQFAVTLNKSAGVDTVSGAGTYTYGSEVTIDATVKTGYTWLNWTDSSGNVVSTNKQHSFTMPAKALTYKANATPNIYKVTLDNQGADIEPGTPAYWFEFGTTRVINGVTAYYYSDASCTTPLKDGYFITVPKKNGYTFGGYYTQPNGVGTQYVSTAGGGINNLWSKQASDITLYAYWLPNDFTLSIDPNGGYRTSDNSTAVISVTKKMGATEGISPRARTGYTLAGYIMKNTATGSTASGDLGNAKFTFAGTSSSSTFTQGYVDITLVAQWNPNIYKVTLDNQGATTAGTANYWYKFNTTGTYNGSTVYYWTNADCTTGLVGSKIELPTKKGYNFGGYYTGTNGSGTQYVNASGTCVNNLYKTVANDITLYAKWTPITYTISYDANGGSGSMDSHSVAYGSTVKIKDNGFTAPTGMKFAGWTTKSDGTNDGYGWSTTSALGWQGTWSYINGQYGIANNALKLYAQWQPITYTVKFDPNNGVGAMENQSHTYGQTYSLTSNTFTREGYSFNGWNTKADGSGTNYSDGHKVSNLAATDEAQITLYAQWKVDNYTINYDLDGGSLSSNNPTSYNITSTTITLNAPVRAGYAFTGWTGSNGTTPQKNVSIPAGSTGNKTFKANWQPNTYTVSFNANGGSGSMPTQNFTVGVSQSIAKNEFTRIYHNFVGWNTKADGSGTSYSDMQVVTDLTVTNNGNVELFAQWNAASTPRLAFIDGINGDDNNDGWVADRPVKTFKQAYTNLPDGGKIFVVNTVTISDDMTLGGYSYKDSTTSIEVDGVSIYRYSPLYETKGQILDGFTTPAFTGNMINVQNGAVLTLDEITIDGSANAGYSIYWNGIFCKYDAVSANGSIILNNGKLVSNKGLLVSNNSSTDGGIICNNGELEMADSQVYGGSGRKGGGIYSTGTAVITNTSFGYNSAVAGGSIYTYDTNGLLTIENSSFIDDRATNYGGAINTTGKAGATISNSEFKDCQANLGGAICTSVKLTLTDLYCQDNYAYRGGAIAAEGDAKLTIDGGVYKYNSATQGGVVYVGTEDIHYIEDGEFSYNYADHGGVAYTNWGSIVFRGGEYHHNEAELGGAIYSDSPFEYWTTNIAGGNFYQNIANSGGAAYTEDALMISGGQIHHNKADLNGGAIALASDSAKALITNSNIADNTAGDEKSNGIYVSGELYLAEKAAIADDTYLVQNTRNGLNSTGIIIIVDELEEDLVARVAVENPVMDAVVVKVIYPEEEPLAASTVLDKFVLINTSDYTLVPGDYGIGTNSFYNAIQLGKFAQQTKEEMHYWGENFTLYTPNTPGINIADWLDKDVEPAKSHQVGSNYFITQDKALYGGHVETPKLIAMANGGEFADGTKTKLLGTDSLLVTEMPDVSFGDYEFLGWSLTQEYDSNNMFELSDYEPNGTQIVYAMWNIPTSFAIYSEDDNSLRFYNRREVPEVGDTFNGLTVSEIWADIVDVPYENDELYPGWTSDSSKDEITTVIVEDSLAPISTAMWFSELPKVNYIDATLLDTSRTTNMALMFQWSGREANGNIAVIGLENWDTSNVLQMGRMFEGFGDSSYGRHTRQISIDITGWDFSKVEYIDNMWGTSAISEIKVGDKIQFTSTDIYDEGWFHDCDDCRWYNVDTEERYESPQAIPEFTAALYRIEVKE